MKILICGSRDWTDMHPIWLILAGWKELANKNGEELVVVHGAAKGADSLAEIASNQLGLETVPVPADWETHGKAAGPIRNSRMINEHEIVAVYAFRSLGKSNGTDDMMRKAAAKHIPVYLTSQVRPNTVGT